MKSNTHNKESSHITMKDIFFYLRKEKNVKEKHILSYLIGVLNRRYGNQTLGAWDLISGFLYNWIEYEINLHSCSTFIIWNKWSKVMLQNSFNCMYMFATCIFLYVDMNITIFFQVLFLAIYTCKLEVVGNNRTGDGDYFDGQVEGVWDLNGQSTRCLESWKGWESLPLRL